MLEVTELFVILGCCCFGVNDIVGVLKDSDIFFFLGMAPVFLSGPLLGMLEEDSFVHESSTAGVVEEVIDDDKIDP